MPSRAAGFAIVSAARLENLAAARDIVAGGPRRAAGLGLFALSPLPSVRLFVAAGLVPRSLIKNSLTSPAGIALHLAMLAGLIVLLRLDWARILTSRRTGRDARSDGDRSDKQLTPPPAAQENSALNPG